MAVDIGGTFTDFVVLDHGHGVVHTEKILTTPRHPEHAIMGGIEKLSSGRTLDLRDTDLFLHATTIITNAVIERKGADFILLHTAGFRDVLEIGREHRYNLTDLKLRFPDPVNKRNLRIAVDERVSAAGEIVRRPDKQVLMERVRALSRSSGIRNFAICFLHAYRNAANEELVRDWIKQEFPDAHVSSSAAVAPTQREYERWTTCTINAYTMPLLAEYVARLEDALMQAGFTGRALMMTSSGLPLEFNRCVGYPIRMIESGPAAGVLAAREIAARIGRPSEHRIDKLSLDDVLAFDMGGTTAKGAFLSSGTFHVQGSLEVARVGTFQPGSGLPLLIPAIDLIEIGAGGGSVAFVDDRGAIAVGPSSVGADPGPACYGRGGTLPTLTDANVALGFLSEEGFASSGIDIQRKLASAALETLADRLGTTLQRAARGVRDTINENVARAFRVHAGELGIDYRRYALLCTGGSAPLHGVEIARILNIKTVAFPFGAGVSSAFGLFACSEGLTLQRTSTLCLDAVSPGRVIEEVRALIASDPNAHALVEAGADVFLTLGMRYVGQGYEIDVAIEDTKRCDATYVRAAFDQAYRSVFGVIFPDYVIEIFNWTLRIMLRAPLSDLRRFHYANAGAATKKLKPPRRVLDIGTGEEAVLAVYDRYALSPGDIIEGGALIEERDTTIYLPHFARGRVTDTFDIVAEVPLRR